MKSKRATKLKRPGQFAGAHGSVGKLRQLVTSAWIEAEAVGVDAERAGTVPDVLMVLKARDMLRDVMAALSIPPNKQAEP